MKTKNIFLLWLWVLIVSAWNVQCSRADDAADERSLPPTRPSEEIADSIADTATPDSISDSTTGEENVVQDLYYNGYVSFSNSRLTVNSLTVTVAPDFQYVVGCLDGSGMVNGSAYSDILLYNDGAAYVRIPWDYSCSLLNGFHWYGPLIYHWDLEYSVVRQAGQPDEITLSGTGRGSHIYEIPYDAWVRSEITFEFRGIQIEGTYTFEGNFALEERSPEEKYNLSLSGSATLYWKQEGE